MESKCPCGFLNLLLIDFFVYSYVKNKFLSVLYTGSAVSITGAISDIISKFFLISFFKILKPTGLETLHQFGYRIDQTLVDFICNPGAKNKTSLRLNYLVDLNFKETHQAASVSQVMGVTVSRSATIWTSVKVVLAIIALDLLIINKKFVWMTVMVKFILVALRISQ